MLINNLNGKIFIIVFGVFLIIKGVLPDTVEKKIQDKIVAITGNSATIENVINPDIIGGFILRVGDVQYDASISNQFKELRREFDNSHYIPQI